MGGGGGGADEDEEDEEELLLEGALLEDEDAGCGGACLGSGSRGSIEGAGCVGAREGRECSRIDARLFSLCDDFAILGTRGAHWSGKRLGVGRRAQIRGV